MFQEVLFKYHPYYEFAQAYLSAFAVLYVSTCSMGRIIFSTLQGCCKAMVVNLWYTCWGGQTLACSLQLSCSAEPKWAHQCTPCMSGTSGMHSGWELLAHYTCPECRTCAVCTSTCVGTTAISWHVVPARITTTVVEVTEQLLMNCC